MKGICSLTLPQSIPGLTNCLPSPSQQTCEGGAAGVTEAPPRAAARSSGEETDSETDSKSSASSTLSS